MKPSLSSTVFQVLALAALAGAAALLANAVAPPARRLAWVGAGFPAAAPPSTPQPVAKPAVEPMVEPAVKPVVEPAREQPVSPAPLARPSHPKTPPAPAVPPTQTQAAPMREISSQEAWEAFQASWPFLDARRTAEFTEGHIPGAWSTPVWEADLDDRLISFKAARRPGPEDPIVIYCSGGDCRDSHLLASRLMREGYGHLLIFRDGFPAWVAQGRPVAKGQP